MRKVPVSYPTFTPIMIIIILYSCLIRNGHFLYPESAAIILAKNDQRIILGTKRKDILFYTGDGARMRNSKRMRKSDKKGENIMKQLCTMVSIDMNFFDTAISVRGNDGLDFMRSDNDAMEHPISAQKQRDNCIHKRC